MKPLKKIALTIALTAGVSAAASAQQVIGAGTYTENFDNIGAGLPSGFSLSTGATASSLGTTGATFATTPTSWATTTGNFRNVANQGVGSGASAPTQAAYTDRSLGLRQTGTFGDPGAAFNFNFSTSLVQVTAISLDLEMLSVQGFSTTFSIQYGVGASPTSFTTLGTYSDPGIFGLTTFSFTTTDFGTNLDNQTSVYLRVVALTPATGTGSRDTVGIDNLSITAIAVPEPSVYVLLGLGILLCGQRFLRRKTA